MDPKNALFPIEITESQIVISMSDEQLWKVLSPIVFTEYGIFFSDCRHHKMFPIAITESGINISTSIIKCIVSDCNY